jgi:hypothetical protein
MATRKSSSKRLAVAGSTSAETGGVATRDVRDTVVITDHDNMVTLHFHATPARSPAALREAYLHHVLSAAARRGDAPCRLDVDLRDSGGGFAP